MKISELKKRLDEIESSHGDIEITIFDGFNGGGDPRCINLGPSVRSIPDSRISYDLDDIDTSDGKIAVMGYGCY